MVKDELESKALMEQISDNMTSKSFEQSLNTINKQIESRLIPYDTIIKELENKYIVLQSIIETRNNISQTIELYNTLLTDRIKEVGSNLSESLQGTDGIKDNILNEDTDIINYKKMIQDYIQKKNIDNV